MTSYETTAEALATTIWEISTGNGRDLGRADWDTHLQHCRATVADSYVEGIDAREWLDAALTKVVNRQQRRVLTAEFHGTMPAIVSTAGLANHDPFIDVIDPTTNAPMRCWLNTADHPERVTSNIYLD